MKDRPKVIFSQFLADAMKWYERSISDEEIRIIDRTSEFYPHIKKEIAKGKLISIQILGPVAGGKSTLGMTIVANINGMLGRKMELSYILADQIDFADYESKSKEKNICLCIDEWNPMSETGFSATVEQKYLDNINRVQAQRFHHRASCSPDVLSDPSANIILEVIDMDKKAMTTTALLYIRFFNRGQWNMQLIGHIQMSVEHTLSQKWYKDYIIRKFRKMEMLNEEAIPDKRMINLAKVEYEIVNRLENMARDDLVSDKLIQTYLKYTNRQHGRRSSIIEDINTAKSVSGFLGTVREHEKMKRKMAKMAKDIKKLETAKTISDTQERDKLYLKGKLVKAQKSITDLNHVIGVLREDMVRIINLGKEYDEIDSDKIKE